MLEHSVDTHITRCATYECMFVSKTMICYIYLIIIVLLNIIKGNIVLLNIINIVKNIVLLNIVKYY